MNSENKNSKLNQISADDIMTRDVAVVNQSASIGKVSQLMLERRISGCPIVDDGGAIVGIVTTTDLFLLIDGVVKEGKAAFKKFKGKAIEEMVDRVKTKPVSSIMTADIHVIAPETPLLELLEKIADMHIHTFPVMKSGKLVGIVGRHDILNATFMYG